MGLAQSQPPTRTYIFQAGQPAVGDQVNKELDNLYAPLNGALSDQNIASNAGISGTKMAVNSIPPAQIVNNSLTDSQIVKGGIGTASIASLAVVSSLLAPVAGKLFATSTVTISTNTPTDVPGCLLTITPKVDSLLMVVAVCDFFTLYNGDTYVGQVLVDNNVPANQGQIIFTSCSPTSATSDRKTVSQSMALFLSAGTAHTVKLQVYKSSGIVAGGTGTANQTHTGFTYFLVSANGTA